MCNESLHVLYVLSSSLERSCVLVEWVQEPLEGGAEGQGGGHGGGVQAGLGPSQHSLNVS